MPFLCHLSQCERCPAVVCWARMHGGVVITKMSCRHQTWGHARVSSVQESFCLRCSWSEQCHLLWDSVGSYKHKMMEANSGAPRRWFEPGLCRLWEWFDCRLVFKSSRDERRRGQRVIRLLLLKEKGTGREEAKLHKSSLWLSPLAFRYSVGFFG